MRTATANQTSEAAARQSAGCKARPCHQMKSAKQARPRLPQPAPAASSAAAVLPRRSPRRPFFSPCAHVHASQSRSHWRRRSPEGLASVRRPPARPSPRQGPPPRSPSRPRQNARHIRKVALLECGKLEMDNHSGQPIKSCLRPIAATSQIARAARGALSADHSARSSN